MKRWQKVLYALGVLVVIGGIAAAVSPAIRVNGTQYATQASSPSTASASKPVQWADTTTVPNLRFSDGTADRYVSACSPTTTGDVCSWNATTGNWQRGTGGSASTGNWTFSANNADLTGAGAMGLGTSVATSLRLFPTTLNFTTATSLAAAAAGATNTVGLTIAPSVTDGASTKNLIVNAATACVTSQCGYQAWQNAGSTIMSLKHYNGAFSGTWLGGGSSGGDGFIVNDASNNLFFTVGGSFTANLTSTAFIPNTDNGLSIGASSNRFTAIWSYEYVGAAVAPAFSATVSVNCTNGETQHVGTVNANVTGATMTSGNTGQLCTVVWAKDATATAYTITWSGTNVRAASAEAMSTTASSLLSQTFRWDGSLATPAWVEIASKTVN